MHNLCAQLLMLGRNFLPIIGYCPATAAIGKRLHRRFRLELWPQQQIATNCERRPLLRPGWRAPSDRANRQDLHKQEYLLQLCRCACRSRTSGVAMSNCLPDYRHSIHHRRERDANTPPPEQHLGCFVHCLPPHSLAVFLFRARFGNTRFASISWGESLTSGNNTSNPGVRPSAPQTAKNTSCLRPTTPASSRSSERLDTPARWANSNCVMFRESRICARRLPASRTDSAVVITTSNFIIRLSWRIRHHH